MTDPEWTEWSRSFKEDSREDPEKNWRRTGEIPEENQRKTGEDQEKDRRGPKEDSSEKRTMEEEAAKRLQGHLLMSLRLGPAASHLCCIFLISHFPQQHPSSTSAAAASRILQ